MIKENQRLLNYFNILTDAAVAVMALCLAYMLRFYVFEGAEFHLRLAQYFRYAVFMVPVYLFIYEGYGLYESFRSTRFLKEFGLIVRANLVGFALFLSVLFVYRGIDVSRWTLVMFWGLNTFGLGAKRYLLRRILRNYRAKGYNLKHVLLIGSGTAAQDYAAMTLRNKDLGYNITGYIAEPGMPKASLFIEEAAGKGKSIAHEIPQIAAFEELSEILENNFYDEVICALDAEYTDMLPSIISGCEKNGLKLSVIPFYYKILPNKAYMEEVEGLPLINMRRIPLDNKLNGICKRTGDILLSSLLIVLTSPVMLFAAIGTKLSSPGPVIFKQERVGKDNKTFTMYKFRSMRVNAQSMTAWSKNEDPRKTKFGSFIRKCSIDELPQFFNVLKGDMSLVGPRPELRKFVDEFKETVPLYMIKHQVRPGITGWAQVNGLRGDTSIRERIEHDIYYIENWSFMLDLKIIAMTALGGIFNKEKLR